MGEGLVDIGNSGRKPTDDEIQKYGLKLFQWATDGVGVVVNPQNPVKALSKSQLLEIFAGKIVNWKVLGGSDKSINVYTRDNSSGTREVFWEKALDKGEITDKANVVVSNGAMKTAVANDPYGIGYVSVGHMDNSTAPVIIGRCCAFYRQRQKRIIQNRPRPVQQHEGRTERTRKKVHRFSVQPGRTKNCG